MCYRIMHSFQLMCYEKVMLNAYQSLVAVNAALCAQLCHNEGEHVLRTALHKLADLLKVGPNSLTCAHAHQLWWLQRDARPL
jgi:hypothetical protein